MNNISKNVRTTESGSEDVRNKTSNKSGFEKVSTVPLAQTLRKDDEQGAAKRKGDEQKPAEEKREGQCTADSTKAKCPDCDADIDLPTDTAEGEIVSCPGCGLELEVKRSGKGCIELQELTIEGEDWGE